jgi:hypothetical protein
MSKTREVIATLKNDIIYCQMCHKNWTYKKGKTGGKYIRWTCRVCEEKPRYKNPEFSTIWEAQA